MLRSSLAHLHWCLWRFLKQLLFHSNPPAAFPFLSLSRRLSSPRSSTLPRSRSTKASWLLGETRTLHGDDFPREHLAALFPWHFLSRWSAVETREGGKNVKVLTVTVLRSTAESGDEMCETSLCVCPSTATPPSTPCSLSSRWCWTKTSSRKLPCYTLSCTRISSRYLTTNGGF